MSSNYFAVFCSFAALMPLIVVSQEQNETCGENEEYNSCGPLCQQSCDTLAIKIRCEDGCLSGCFCKFGYVRDKENKCIPASECPPESCPENEEPSECASICNDCKIRGRGLAMCYPGCECKKGYYRNSTGTCIPEELCPAECGKNEERRECGPLCQYCGPYHCLGFICGNPCFCKEGYRRGPDLTCIPENQCPGYPGCGENEVRLECGSVCQLCGDAECTSTICGNLCFCKDGYRVGPENTCIPEDQCPITTA